MGFEFWYWVISETNRISVAPVCSENAIKYQRINQVTTLVFMRQVATDDSDAVAGDRLTRQPVKGLDSAVRQELDDAERKVEQCKVCMHDWNFAIGC